MSERLLLDTHIVLWLDSGSDRLRDSTRDLIDRCWSGGGTISMSVVTAWEIALLANTGRIGLDVPASNWIERFLARPGVEEACLSWRTAAMTYEWPEFEHRDPADRMLTATAISLECPLVTYDERLTDFGRRYGAKYGLRIAS